jgi:hypothetical protein
MKRAILILIMLSVGLRADAASKQVRLKADRVVLRLQPSFRAEVVTQVSKGDILVSNGVEGDWVQVLPPADVYYYVHSRYVEKGIVTGARVRMRTGAGVGHAIVDELKEGERIDIKGVWDEWVKLKPPLGCTLWVHKTLVEDVFAPPSAPPKPVKVIVTPVAKPEQKKAPAPVKRPVVVATAPVAVGPGPKAAETPAVIKKEGLVPLPGQGRLKSYEGVLDKKGVLTGEIRKYRLVGSNDRRRKTVCYVMGNKAQLSELVGSAIVVAGREYWILGEKLPILVAEEIVVHQRPVAKKR